MLQQKFLESTKLHLQIALKLLLTSFNLSNIQMRLFTTLPFEKDVSGDEIQKRGNSRQSISKVLLLDIFGKMIRFDM